MSDRQPLALPFCSYPSAIDLDQHGLQPLLSELECVDFSKVRPYRSSQYKTVPAVTLENHQILQLARLIAKSFAKRETMLRHLNLPSYPSIDISNTIHEDVFGKEDFGDWSWENWLYWSIRLYDLTDSKSPDARIRDEVLEQSVAIVDEGNVIGGAINIPLSPPKEASSQQRQDSYLEALSFDANPFVLLSSQEEVAVENLTKLIPDFQQAYHDHQVGAHHLVARSDALPTLDAFELVAGTLENYRKLDFKYVVTSASNQWTGAAFTLLGGVKVHFAPFRLTKLFPESQQPIANRFSSPDGFISAKDSGVMFYVVRLL